MSELDTDSAGNKSGDLEIVKPDEVETPSSSNAEIQLAGSIEIDDEARVNSSNSPRGEKRRLSHEKNGDSNTSKRFATDDENNENLVDSTNHIQHDSSNKLEKNEQLNDVGNEATPKDENKDENKSAAPEAVIEISDDSSDSDICAVVSYQATADEVKRIRGDNYSSSSDYSSDSSSSSGEDDSVVLPVKRNRMLGPVRGHLEPRALRTDLPKLDKRIISPDSTDRLSAHWAQSKDLNDEQMTLTCEPFKLCLLRNLLYNSEMINNIVDDMNTLDWTRKKMDLYEFHQTTDLANLTWQRSIRGIYDMLKHEIMPWVSKVTGLKLTNISASCSLYGPGDHLLVHDDLLSDRRVAFILYLAPWTLKSSRRSGDDKIRNKNGWSESMGGALELFSVDENGQPAKAVKSVLPENNMLAFFQVSPVSYHQVSEVMSLEYPRLSINGWFHGPGEEAGAAAETTHTPPAPCKPHSEIVLMQEWFTAQYMTPRTRLQIQQQMEKASEISLRCFLNEQKYQRVLEALRAPETPWVEVGPANQRRYEVLPLAAIEELEREHPVRELVKLLTSTNMYRFVRDCSDLNVQVHSGVEVQRWKAGCYTVLPPKELYAQNQLDAVLYAGLPEEQLCGGVITYVAPEEENSPPLISLQPVNNALNLVYKDSQTARFTKHVSRRLGPDRHFYIVTVSYRED